MTEEPIAEDQSVAAQIERITAEDKPASAGASAPTDLPYSDTELIVVRLHESSEHNLRSLRAKRDEIEDRIRVEVGIEYRLRRMVGIVERAYQEGGDATTEAE